MSFTWEQIPHCTIHKILDFGEYCVINGDFDREHEFKEGYHMELYAGGDVFVSLKILYLKNDGRRVIAKIAQKDKGSFLTIGGVYPAVHCWMAERAEVVLSPIENWKQATFVPRDCISISPNGNRELIKGGWDHEHCRICNEVLCAKGCHASVGYRNEADHWVCEQCYEKWMVPKCLDCLTELVY
jgi:hypothetical protein